MMQIELNLTLILSRTYWYNVLQFFVAIDIKIRVSSEPSVLNELHPKWLLLVVVTVQDIKQFQCYACVKLF